ncbi:hypothetical protein E2C01_018190 [Portunus trituberculatus]|uniref:Uncharacterized protein n=1 Tax=Portunus trituberculatus TaxID=210409 RepID=A0A5B7DTV8_PORTR|nr:hypothetical protein [Portunus trituberculatus]
MPHTQYVPLPARATRNQNRVTPLRAPSTDRYHRSAVPTMVVHHMVILLHNSNSKVRPAQGGKAVEGATARRGHHQSNTTRPQDSQECEEETVPFIHNSIFYAPYFRALVLQNHN